MAIIGRLAGTLCFLTILTACSETDPYAVRDGKAEALADISSKAPLKLYFHAYNGVIPEWKTPGLQSCEPDDPFGSKVFKDLETGDWQEGEDYSAEEIRLQVSAWKFGRAYNLAIFRARENDVVAVCPKAKPE